MKFWCMYFSPKFSCIKTRLSYMYGIDSFESVAFVYKLSSGKFSLNHGHQERISLILPRPSIYTLFKS